LISIRCRAGEPVEESLTDLVVLAEILDSTGRLSLALMPEPLVVQPLDGVEERPRPVAAATRSLQRVNTASARLRPG
jgi:hypothetical protein